jgi:hypothetical protein
MHATRAADRLMTPWLPILRAHKPRAPHVRVKLTTVGAELRTVSAQVLELAGTFLERHERLAAEFEDPVGIERAWPKHLVVEYVWEQQLDTDSDAGLLAVLVTGVHPTGLGTARPCSSFHVFQTVVAEPGSRDLGPGAAIALSACLVSALFQRSVSRGGSR